MDGKAIREKWQQSCRPLYGIVAGDAECLERLIDAALAQAVAEEREALCALLPLTAPSGVPMCVCRNVNAVRAGAERACWYCQVRARRTP